MALSLRQLKLNRALGRPLSTSLGLQKEGEKGWLSRIMTGQHSQPSGADGSESPQTGAHSSLLSTREHVFELHTQTARPGHLSAYLSHYRDYVHLLEGKGLGTELVGSWRTVVGNQDQCVHLWRHNKGYATADAVIQAGVSDQDLVAANEAQGALVSKRINALLLSFSYWPDPAPRDPSHLYELRSYILRPGTMIEWGNNWARGINYRMDHNQAAGGFFSQVGRLYMVFHLWAYKDMMARKQIREETWSKPGWDTNVTYTVPLIRRMRSRVMVPNDFSPMK